MDAGIESLIAESRGLHSREASGRINFCFTGDIFPAYSLTGAYCALSCKHCGGKLIERLKPVKTPEDLIKACLTAYEKGAKGVLLTGGCTAQAKVPIYPFLDAVSKIKKETGLVLIAHTGLASPSEAAEISRSGIDGVCLDVVGSPDVSQEVYGVRITPEMYRSTLLAYEDAGMPGIYPHICLGLLYGRLSHELSALEVISCIKPGSIVLTGLTGIGGTPMEGVGLVAGDFIRILCRARKAFPDVYLALGCARGVGTVKEEIDRMAVRAGVDAVAVPTRAAYDEARRLGLRIRECPVCCAIPQGV